MQLYEPETAATQAMRIARNWFVAIVCAFAFCLATADDVRDAQATADAVAEAQADAARHARAQSIADDIIDQQAKGEKP
jgi:hypothetical protein